MAPHLRNQLGVLLGDRQMSVVSGTTRVTAASARA